MSRRYDSRTTTFSPEGRLLQVEYAMEAISNGGSVVGIICKDCILISGERKTVGPLLDQSLVPEKFHSVDDHIVSAVAGLSSDAHLLVKRARELSMAHDFYYGEPIPLQKLLTDVCNYMQGYTQSGGLRPFGVSMLVAGYDAYEGLQMYVADPSGNFYAWQATAFGTNSKAAQTILNDKWSSELSYADGMTLLATCLAKVFDGVTLTSDSLELMCLRVTEGTDGQLNASASPVAFSELEPLIASCRDKMKRDAESQMQIQSQ